MRTVEKHTLNFLKKFLLCVCLLKLIAFSSVANAASVTNFYTDIGRFSSLDPAGSPNGPNRYNYCGSDPVNRSDASGLWWEYYIGNPTNSDDAGIQYSMHNAKVQSIGYDAENRVWYAWHGDGDGTGETHYRAAGAAMARAAFNANHNKKSYLIPEDTMANGEAFGQAGRHAENFAKVEALTPLAAVAVVAGIAAVPAVIEVATPTVVATTTTATAAATRVAQEATQIYVEAQQTWNNVYDRYQLWIEGGEFAYQYAGLPGSEFLGYGTHAANGNNWGPRARGGMRVEQRKISNVPGRDFSPKPNISAPYTRPQSAGPTKEQRDFVQGKPCVDCGSVTNGQIADHIDPLSVEYYRTGTNNIDHQSSVDAVQPHCPSCSSSQGGYLSAFTRRMREALGLKP